MRLWNFPIFGVDVCLNAIFGGQSSYRKEGYYGFCDPLRFLRDTQAGAGSCGFNADIIVDSAMQHLQCDKRSNVLADPTKSRFAGIDLPSVAFLFKPACWWPVIVIAAF